MRHPLETAIDHTTNLVDTIITGLWTNANFRDSRKYGKMELRMKANPPILVSNTYMSKTTKHDSIPTFLY
jgi:hypothetical protein